MNPLRTTLLALACALPLTALAQWVWVDKDGRKVYSDRSPPAEVPARNILKQPGMKGPPPAAAAEAAAAVATTAKAPASAPRVSGKDRALEDKKKQAEQEEEAKAKAEEEKVAKAKAENCDKARRSLQALSSGERVRAPNAKGELEFMSDSARSAETKRLQGVIDGCKS